MIQQTLKEMVGKKGIREVARQLGLDHGNLYRSLDSDLRLSTCQAILGLFGYELRIVRRKGMNKGNYERQGKSKKGRV